MTNVFVWSVSGGGKFQLSGSRLSAGAARNITHEARKQNRSRQNFPPLLAAVRGAEGKAGARLENVAAPLFYSSVPGCGKRFTVC